VAVKLCQGTPISCVVLFGGENINSQLNKLNHHGCHVAVATPGRIVDHLQRCSMSFAACQHLILDEADRMLDMGFEPQIRKVVQDPAHKMPPASHRSTSLFSATFPSEVRILAKDFVNKQPSTSQLPKCVEFVVSDTAHAEKGQHLPSNVQHSWEIQATYREIFHYALRLTREFASEKKRILIFLNKKADVDAMDKQLYRQNVQCASIHGDKSQRARDEALAAFRSGEVNTLLATNVAARGLDIPEVGLVINVGIPPTADDYIHRCGRAGRLGREGRCINLLTQGDLYGNKTVVAELNQLLRRSNQPLIC